MAYLKSQRREFEKNRSDSSQILVAEQALSNSKKADLTLISLPSVFHLFSGLILPQLGPSHRHSRVSVIFLQPSLVDWMAHLNLLFTGLAC